MPHDALRRMVGLSSQDEENWKAQSQAQFVQVNLGVHSRWTLAAASQGDLSPVYADVRAIMKRESRRLRARVGLDCGNSACDAVHKCLLLFAVRPNSVRRETFPVADWKTPPGALWKAIPLTANGTLLSQIPRGPVLYGDCDGTARSEKALRSTSTPACGICVE